MKKFLVLLLLFTNFFCRYHVEAQTHDVFSEEIVKELIAHKMNQLKGVRLIRDFEGNLDSLYVTREVRYESGLDSILSNGNLYGNQLINSSNFNTSFYQKQIYLNNKLVKDTVTSDDENVYFKSYLEVLNDELVMLDPYLLFNRIRFINPLSEMGLSLYHYQLDRVFVFQDEQYFVVTIDPNSYEGNFLRGTLVFSLGKSTLLYSSWSQAQTSKSEVINLLLYNVLWGAKEGSVFVVDVLKRSKVKLQNNDHSSFLIVNECQNTPDDKSFFDKFNTANKSNKEVIPLKKATFFDQLMTNYLSLKGFDIGLLSRFVNYNSVEGLRLGLGFRTHFTVDDLWRLKGEVAYGFKDGRVKYHFSYSNLLRIKDRLLIGCGMSDDVYRVGVGLNVDDLDLGRFFRATELSTTYNNSSLASVKTKNAYVGFTPLTNLDCKIQYNLWQATSATSGGYHYDYLDEAHLVHSFVNQSVLSFSLKYSPGKRVLGLGVDRKVLNNDYSVYLFSYTKGLSGFLVNGFDYHMLHWFQYHPVDFGHKGKLMTSLELSKIFGSVSPMLLSFVPANRSVVNMQNNFATINYNDFVMDSYVIGHAEYNFKGAFLKYISKLHQFGMQEVIGVRAIYGELSESNYKFNSLYFSQFNGESHVAPTKVFYEYNIGIDRFFKNLRLDLYYRGNYYDLPSTHKWSFKVSFGYLF